MGIDQECFVISYMGSLFTFSGLLQVVSDFAKLSEPSDRLVIIGSGDIENELKRKVKELDLESKVIFTGIISYAELPQYLSVSDVLINPFESTLVTNLALPHKVLQYLATGITTVSTELSGLFHSLSDETGIHWVNSPESIVQACMNLKQESLAKKTISSTLGKDFVNKHFSQEVSLAEIEATLNLVTRDSCVELVAQTSKDVAIVVPTLGIRTDYLRLCLNSLRKSGAGLLCVIAPKDLNLDDFVGENLFDLRFDDDGDGLANAINKAFSLLPHDVKFMSWLGDDDLIEVNALNIAREKMISDSEVVAVVGICEYIGPYGEKILTNKAGSLGIKILSWGPDLIPQPGSLLRRSAFDQMGGLDTRFRMAFDLDMFLRLQKLGRIEFLNQKVASFRWHPTSLSVDQRRYAVLEASAIRRHNHSKFVSYISLIWEPLIIAFTLGLGTVVNFRKPTELDAKDERILNA
jgi:GT2 family glycosyltransferase